MYPDFYSDIALELLKSWAKAEGLTRQDIEQMDYDVAFEQYTDYVYGGLGKDGLVRYICDELDPSFIRDNLNEVFGVEYLKEEAC